MKHAYTCLLGVCIVMLLSFSANAISLPIQQQCQARKNIIVGKYAECVFKAESKPGSARKYQAKIKRCKDRLQKSWFEIVAKTTAAGATCLDAPLTDAYFIDEVDSHVYDVTTRLGKFVTLAPAARHCRATKNLIIGKYNICRQRAESRLAKNNNTTLYNELIALRCETLFERRWQAITEETLAGGSACYDDTLGRQYFKSLVDEHTKKVAAELAGNSQVDFAITGSSLALTASGAAGNITITNLSNLLTAYNISSDFSGSALDGKVTETGNTCASVAPGASCTLSFTPGGVAVQETSFSIKGTNTLSGSAAISIASLPQPTLTVTGAPLSLTVNGITGTLIITNTSTTTSATNIVSNFTGTALDGNVTETGNTCANLVPSASCTLTFTPGNTVVPLTDFTIEGSNTLPVMASISIESGVTLVAVSSNSGATSGGVGVTLTGTGLTGATQVTFGGIAATSVNVVNSTTITAVTPAHPVGVVDVVVDTPSGGATLVNGYTYAVTAVGQSAQGGTIACLDGGLQDLIAATTDNSSGVVWGGFVVTMAQSFSDGAANTATIVSFLGAGNYAAQLCNDYQVDSQGNTPCQVGNICYNDWFLPAKDQLDCLYTNRVNIGGFLSTTYWGSTEDFFSSDLLSEAQDFNLGVQTILLKNALLSVRCTRSFVP